MQNELVTTIWEEYWKNTPHTPIVTNPNGKGVYDGNREDLLTSMGMASFLEAVKPHFKDGFKVLDYGCGAGALANFVSERLEDFHYWGLEPSSGQGGDRIQTARNAFGNDSRVKFGTIDEDLSEILKNPIDAVILISVFTHLEINDTYDILANLKKVFEVNPQSSIVFSCFTAEERRLHWHQPQIWERYYHESYIRERDLKNWCKDNELQLVKVLDFHAAHGYVHEIYKIVK
jgi:cyclopropane fatty-acyl-phospholipid synthase-like methyltransferase